MQHINTDITLALAQLPRGVEVGLAAIDRVEGPDAGAASGLVNVTQQLGGTLGVAILVTVFGSAAAGASRLAGGDAAAQAAHVFTVGATHAFTAATVFLLAAMALVAVAVKAPRQRPAAG